MCAPIVRETIYLRHNEQGLVVATPLARPLGPKRELESAGNCDDEPRAHEARTAAHAHSARDNLSPSEWATEHSQRPGPRASLAGETW